MRSHDMCQSYQEYHSCFFNHMGDYDSLCAIVTTKTPAPFEGGRISVWEPQGYLRLLLILVISTRRYSKNDLCHSLLRRISRIANLY